MGFASDRATHRRDTLSFVICVGLSVTALFVPPRWGESVTSAIRETVLQPVLWLQQSAERGRTSQSRFLAVMAQRDSAVLAARSLNVLTSENQQLRALLGLGRRLGTSYIAAEVLHQPLPTDGRTILLSAGSRDGVRPYAPVLSADGLVGVVQTVEPNWSIAMTWAHSDFRAGAFTEDGAVFGIVAPANAASPSETVLELRGVPYRDSIVPGTRVVASGLGGVFPQGIPIGTVMGVLREERGWERTYLLRPASHPMSISHVIILIARADSSAGKAFRRDSSLP
ncbi:MAG: rod shape-determining protein MreC [Gemmatimonadota bacterium]